MNETWLPILAYSDFYDFPRIFIARVGGRLLLFDGRFDDAIDDYPEHFNVLRLPDSLGCSEFPEDLRVLQTQARETLGSIAVVEAAFDCEGHPKRVKFREGILPG